MKEIELTQGKKTIVDDEDFDWLSTYDWYAAHWKPHSPMMQRLLSIMVSLP